MPSSDEEVSSSTDRRRSATFRAYKRITTEYSNEAQPLVPPSWSQQRYPEILPSSHSSPDHPSVDGSDAASASNCNHSPDNRLSSYAADTMMENGENGSYAADTMTENGENGLMNGDNGSGSDTTNCENGSCSDVTNGENGSFSDLMNGENGSFSDLMNGENGSCSDIINSENGSCSEITNGENGFAADMTNGLHSTESDNDSQSESIIQLSSESDEVSTNQTEEFVWTPYLELHLLNSLRGLRPVGIYYHFYVALIHERFTQAVNRDIPMSELKKKLHTFYNLDEASRVCGAELPCPQSEFSLPEDEFPEVAEIMARLREEKENTKTNNNDNNSHNNNK